MYAIIAGSVGGEMGGVRKVGIYGLQERLYSVTYRLTHTACDTHTHCVTHTHTHTPSNAVMTHCKYQNA